MKSKQKAPAQRATARSNDQALLLDNIRCARVMGVGINRFYELRRLDPAFPAPVALPLPSDRRMRELRAREDVERYIRELSRRGKSIASA